MQLILTTASQVRFIKQQSKKPVAVQPTVLNQNLTIYKLNIMI